MKEAIEQFHTQLGAAIDSTEFVKRALDRQELTTGKACLIFAAVHGSVGVCAGRPPLSFVFMRFANTRSPGARPPPPADSISHLGREKPMSLMPIFFGAEKKICP
ncbi:MAG: hypothetical protein WAU53_21350 [Rhodoplanes sp.]